MAGKGVDPARPRQRLDAWHARLARVSIENPPYEDFIARDDWRETLFAGPRGWFIPSRDDAPELRRLFASCAIEAVETAYHAAPGANILKVPWLRLANS